MPPLKETGKQRAIRIPLDYYKRPHFMERWKRWAAIIAFVTTLAWLGTSLLRSDQNRLSYSRGPVAGVHAAWDAQCDACHVPFQPITNEAWVGTRLGQVSNERCQACHAGPPHHTGQTPDLNCADCHHEHKGRTASLVHLPDNDCTRCHSDLAAHGKKDAAMQNVASLAEHPEFRLLREQAKDPGKLQFSHKLHMSPGMATPERGNPNFKLSSIPAAFRERYRGHGEGDDTLVQLDCSSCHRLDSGDFKIDRAQLTGLPSAAVLPARTGGAYFLPITYENQCQACHPLTFERKDPTNPLSGHVSVPHRLQPAEVHDYLEGHYTRKVLQDEKNAFFNRQVTARALPGKSLSDDQQTIRKGITDKVGEMERMLFSPNTCGRCHQVEQNGAASRKIEPPGIKDVWFERAAFNHAPHRAVSCRECHSQAYPDDKQASVSSQDVMLPGVKNCQQCHGPRVEEKGQFRGGARFDCVECHRYHHRDAPQALLQGPGAAAHGVTGKQLDINQFLSGNTPEGPK
jgi:hypothetical protein